MKETLTRLFGDAVDEEKVKAFNGELGKKFVSKADFNAKIDEIKALKSEKEKLEGEIATLSNAQKNGDDVKAELDALKKQIEADKAAAESARVQKEKNENIEKRFNECVGDRQFNHDAIRELYLKKFGEALDSDDFAGKADSDIFKSLTQNDGTAFRGIVQIPLAGGKPQATGKTYNTKEEIMSIKDRSERRQAIAENPSLFGLFRKGD